MCVVYVHKQLLVELHYTLHIEQLVIVIIFLVINLRLRH